MKKKFRKLKVRDLSEERPVRIRSLGDRIAEWVIFGGEDGREAVGTLFPVKVCNCKLCV